MEIWHETISYTICVSYINKHPIPRVMPSSYKLKMIYKVNWRSRVQLVIEKLFGRSLYKQKTVHKFCLVRKFLFSILKSDIHHSRSLRCLNSKLFFKPICKIQRTSDIFTQIDIMSILLLLLLFFWVVDNSIVTIR